MRRLERLGGSDQKGTLTPYAEAGRLTFGTTPITDISRFTAG